MRASLLGLSSVCLLLTAFIPTISAVTLDQFQPIHGFSQACIDAYNTPLSGCTASDFKSGSCSMTCIAFLEALTHILNSECGGTSASPNTLIGSFFENEGTSILCPNVLSGSKEASYGPTVTNGQARASATYIDTPASAAAPSSYTSQTLPILSAAPSQFSSSTSTRSTTAGAAATTTRVAVVKTTVSSQIILPEPSSSSSGTSSSKTSITPRPSASETTSSGGGGAGGSPLDVGSSAANHNGRIEAWVLGLMAGSAGLALLL